MKCLSCSEEIPDDSIYCRFCGSRAQDPPKIRLIEFPAISLLRLTVLSLLSLGLYQFYWIYLNWQALRKAEGSRISPFWRTSFIFFYCHDLFARMMKPAKEQGFKPAFDPWIPAIVYIGLLLLGMAVQNNLKTFALGLAILQLAFLPLLPVQQAVNAYYQTATGGKPLRTQLGAGEILSVVLGFLLLLMSLLAMSLLKSVEKMTLPGL